MRNSPQIYYPVIETVSVDVVYFSIGKLAVHIEPSQPMRRVRSAANPNPPVFPRSTACIRASLCFGRGGNPPNKNTRLRIVRKQVANFISAQHHSPLSSGAISKASHRADSINERAKEIRLRAIQESIGTVDDFGDRAEFFSAIAESRLFFDFSDFISADGYARIGIPRVSDAIISPA
jgi:hypothetical protein